MPASAVTLLGLAATGWGVEKIVAMKQGDVYDVGPYQLEIVGADRAARGRITRKPSPI